MTAVFKLFEINVGNKMPFGRLRGGMNQRKRRQYGFGGEGNAGSWTVDKSGNGR